MFSCWKDFRSSSKKPLFWRFSCRSPSSSVFTAIIFISYFPFLVSFERASYILCHKCGAHTKQCFSFLLLFAYVLCVKISFWMKEKEERKHTRNIGCTRCAIDSMWIVNHRLSPSSSSSSSLLLRTFAVIIAVVVVFAALNVLALLFSLFSWFYGRYSIVADCQSNPRENQTHWKRCKRTLVRVFGSADTPWVCLCSGVQSSLSKTERWKKKLSFWNKIDAVVDTNWWSSSSWQWLLWFLFLLSLFFARPVVVAIITAVANAIFHWM